MTAHLHARQQSRERGDEEEESDRSHGEALFNCMSLYAYSMAGQMIFSERGWSAEFAQAKQRSHLAPRDGYHADASFERPRSVFRHGLPLRRLKHLQGVDRGRARLGGHEAEGVIGIWEHLGEAED